MMAAPSAWDLVRKRLASPGAAFSLDRRRQIERVVAAGGPLLDLGASTRRIAGAIRVDLVAYPGTGVVADLHDLPFRPASVGGAILTGVLEHVERPARVVAEVRRAIRPGGLLYASAPFVQGYHPDPLDRWRWTPEGFPFLFDGFRVVETGLSAGPASGAVWVLREFLALVTSFGSRRLYKVGAVAWGWLLLPLKYLDLLLARHPEARRIASGTYVLAERT
jgi:SAM-dependent methyltransferase